MNWYSGKGSTDERAVPALVGVALAVVLASCTSATPAGKVDGWLSLTVVDADVVEVTREDGDTYVLLDVRDTLAASDDGREASPGESVTVRTRYDLSRTVSAGDTVTAWVSLGGKPPGLHLVATAEGRLVEVFVDDWTTRRALQRLGPAERRGGRLVELTTAADTPLTCGGAHVADELCP